MLATFLTLTYILEHFLISECPIRVFHYKVIILLESIDLRSTPTVKKAQNNKVYNSLIMLVLE